MTTTTETVLSTPIVRKPAEENGEKPQQRSADWENPRVASILSAAAKCFARKGFTATTLAEIGKELGLRKSIVHYYFASKAALIHEVQSYTYHRYLDRLREAIKNGDGSVAQTPTRCVPLGRGAEQQDRTGLNIEVWSAARRDVELKRRAAGLHRDARRDPRRARTGCRRRAARRGPKPSRHCRSPFERPVRHRIPRGEEARSRKRTKRSCSCCAKASKLRERLLSSSR